MGRFFSYQKLDPVHVAKEVLAQWKKESTFEKSLALRRNAPQVHFYEGPPGANGRPGIHHVFCRTLKDIFCRYKTMQGYLVARKGGWDTHGLPVEITVEQELGITKKDIGTKISVADYNKACKKAVMRYQKEWEHMTERIGYWLDLNHPYITCDRGYINAVWGVIKKLYEKDYIYKGYCVQPYSPAAGTGLSNHELNQPGCYKEVKDISLVAQFAVKAWENTYFLAWTTTPWTLPANSALAVHPHLTYVKVRTYHPYSLAPIYVVLSKGALKRYFSEEDRVHNEEAITTTSAEKRTAWFIAAQMKGTDLVGMYYEQLLPYVDVKGDPFRVIPADFVTDADGTGIVHIAPNFGVDDAEVAKQHHIPAVTVSDQHGREVPIVDMQGRFVKEITDFAGAYVKQAYDPEKRTNPSVDHAIAQLLKKHHQLFHIDSCLHSYPHCWRTDKPILYYPLHARFIKTTACKERLIALNKEIQWQPVSTGQGRFGDWLTHLVDWNITRDRFWGTPIPIWCTQDHSEEICIGSLEELHKEVEKSVQIGFMKEPLPEDIDLHRPYVDDIILVSPQGQKMFREPGVFDVWGDSGAMPYAQHATNAKETLPMDKPPTAFPADFIVEGIDQTRGWFFTLHALAVMLHGQIAYKRVLSTGLVLDKKGQKMSKRLGNVIDPNLILDTYGPDVLRWYMIGNGDPWDNLKFDETALTEVQRKFFGTLYHTYQFFVLYANLDGFEGEGAVSFTVLSDRWILSRLQGLIKKVRNALDNLSPTQAVRAIQSFVVDDLSNWYVRLNRKRFWRGKYDSNKQDAYWTLYHCLRTVAVLAAPIAPFYMDRLYQDLNKKEKKSVHLTDFPVIEPAWIDLGLEESMHHAQTISSLIHRLRKKHNVKVRQPLQRILVPLTSTLQKEKITPVIELILRETNVKELRFVESVGKMFSKKLKPNYVRLGKVYGQQTKTIAKVLREAGQQMIETLEKKGELSLLLTDGTSVTLTREDIIIVTEDIAGWAVAKEQNMTVALDLQRTSELTAEGMARELVNRLQNMRKDLKLAVEDKISLALSSTTHHLRAALQKHEHYITEEVQINKLRWQETSTTDMTPITLEEGTVHVKISPAKKEAHQVS